MGAARPIIDRLMEKVDKHPDGCWIFTGAKIATGYGKISDRRSHAVFAHRVSYAHFKGPIPPGLKVLHQCDNPSCVNPDHLSVGTQKENWLDARAKGRNFAKPQITPNYRYVHWLSLEKHRHRLATR